MKNKTTKWILKDGLWLCLTIVASLWLAYQFFEYRNLFNTHDIFHNDYPRFIYKGWLMRHNNIAEFNSLFGYYDQLYSGYPVIHIYPVGLLFILNFLNLFGISYAIAMRITLVGIFLLMGLIPYHLVQRRTQHGIGGFFAAVWFLFANNSQNLWVLHYGMLSYVLAAYVAFYYLMLLEERDFSKENSMNLFRTKQDYLRLILFVFVIFVNYMASILIGAVMGIYFIKCYFQKHHKYYFFYCLKLTVVSVLITAVWLLPTIFIQFPQVAFPGDASVFAIELSIEMMKYYTRYNVFWVVVSGVAAIFLLIYREKENKPYFIPIIIIFLGYFAAYGLPSLNLTLFSGINSLRYLVFLEITAAFCFGCLINPDLIKKTIKKTKRLYNSEKDTLFFLYANHTLALCLIILGSLNLAPGTPAYQTYRGPVYQVYQFADTTYETQMELDYTSMEPELSDVIDWIKENTTKTSRILFQDSGDESGLEINGGHNLCLIALYTDRYYANGYLDHFWYKHSENSTFLADNFYGKSIQELSIDFVEDRLIVHNIEFIIVWSESGQNWFSQASEEQSSLQAVADFDKYQIYQFKNAPQTFINCSYATAEFNPSEYRFCNATLEEGTYVTFAFHDTPNWEILVDGRRIEKIEDRELNPDGFIMFLVDEEIASEKAQIVIRWRKTGVEHLSEIISLFSVVFVALWTNAKFRNKVQDVLEENPVKSWILRQKGTKKVQ